MRVDKSKDQSFKEGMKMKVLNQNLTPTSESQTMRIKNALHAKNKIRKKSIKGGATWLSLSLRRNSKESILLKTLKEF